MSPDSPVSDSLRDQLAWLMAAVALAICAGRIAVVTSREGDTAFLSANDRSRWATVAALVEDGRYEIDRLMRITDKSGRRHPWQTIDRVRHTGPDGRMHDYSSKPPLLATMVAGVYALAHATLGMTLTDQPIYMTRIVLAAFNLPTLLLLIASSWWVIRGSVVDDFAKLVAMAVTCLGTMLLPMSVSLGNHLPAAAYTALVVAIYLGREGGSHWRRMTAPAMLAGVAAALVVACELPALLMLVLWTLLFFRQDVRSTLLGFLPGVLLVTVAFFATNWLAHRSLIPPYAHRGDGKVIGQLDADGLPNVQQVAQQVAAAGQLHRRHAEQLPKLVATPSPDRWVAEFGQGDQRFVLVRRSGSDAGRSRWQLRLWDHWYDYPSSYWMGQRRGVDRGEPSRWRYTFHMLIGHHGVFSLTPFWLLVPIALAQRLRDSGSATHFWLATAILVTTLVCIAFYISRPLIDRNYGGVSCCFRWLLWLAPLWIWAALPAAGRLATSRPGRVALVGLAAAGVFSAATSLESPWRHPWIYRYLEFLGWLTG